MVCSAASVSLLVSTRESRGDEFLHTYPASLLAFWGLEAQCCRTTSPAGRQQCTQPGCDHTGDNAGVSCGLH